MDQYADSGQPIGDDLSQYAQSIKDIESSGGNYGAVGPQTSSGDRAYGAYQVMGNNVPDWTEKHYGTRLTPSQFLKNNDAQDAVFNGEFGAALKKHGNPQDAAAVWFSGRPLSQSASNSDGYITTRQYVNKFNQGLKRGGGALAYANDDDEYQEDNAPTTTQDAQPALAQGQGALTKGQWKRVLKGDPQDPWSGFGSSMAQVGAALAGISNPQQANALTNIAQQITNDAQSKYKISVGKDGTIYRIDDRGNVLAGGGGSGPTPGSKGFKPMHRVNPASGLQEAGVLDNATGKVKWDGGDGVVAPPVPTSPEDLRAIDPARANAAQAVFEGRVRMPVGSRMNQKQQQLRDDVFHVYPGIDENTFTGRNTWTKNFATDQPSQPGGQAVGLGHSREILSDLGENMLAQGNYGSGILPSAVGHVINAVRNTGADSTPLVKTGADLTDKLVTETGRLYSGNQGGGVHERERTAERFGGDTQNLTPKEQAGLLREQRKLIDQRQGQVEDQRDLLFGKDGASRFDLLGDRGRAANSRLDAVLAKMDPAGPEAQRLNVSNGGSKSPANRPPLAGFF